MPRKQGLPNTIAWTHIRIMETMAKWTGSSQMGVPVLRGEVDTQASIPNSEAISNGLALPKEKSFQLSLTEYTNHT